MRLKEIEYLRPILFVQLFCTHAFTIFTASSWKMPVGIERIELYDWIARLSYSCMLELFTFISGYVFFFVSQNKDLPFGKFVYSKFRRLMVPSIIFSILYYLFFIHDEESGLYLIYNILCGEGHLWYLPMLFVCFLIAFFVRNVKRKHLLLIGALVISSFSRFPNVFRMSQVSYYFFFFYLGIFVCRDRAFLIRYLIKNWNMVFISISVLFVLSLAILLPLNVELKLYNADSWIYGYFLSAGIRFINIVYSTVGVAFWYVISIRLAQKIIRMPVWIPHFNVLSMGVYIFHQFILMFLDYHTTFPAFCGSIVYPWFSIFISMPVSVLLSYTLRLTKIGKSLI